MGNARDLSSDSMDGIPAKDCWTNWDSLRTFVWQGGLVHGLENNESDLLLHCLLDTVPKLSHAVVVNIFGFMPRLFSMQSRDGTISEQAFEHRGLDKSAWRYVTEEGEVPLGLIPRF